MSLIRSSAWAASAAILLTASRFALGAILARRLSQDAFGQFAYGQWLVDVSFLLCSLGATGAISRFGAEYRHDPDLLATFVRRWQPFALGLPALAACGVLLGAWLSGLTIGSTGLAALAAWTLTNGLWAMQSAALVGLQRFDIIFRANTVFATVTLAGAVLLPWVKGDPTYAFALMAIASACAVVFGLRTTYRLGHGNRRATAPVPWGTVVAYAANIWFSAFFASLVWSRGELPIIKAILGDVSVAHYAAALTLFGGLVQGAMLGVSGIAPHLTRLWGEGKKEKAIDLSRSIMDLQLAITAIGSLFVICFGAQVISLTFTDAYRDAAMPLSILCLGLVTFVVSSQSHLLQLETNARFNRNTVLLGALVLYALAFALVPVFGLMGAALARAGAMVILGLITVLFSVRHWGWRSVSATNMIVVLATLSISMVIGNVLAESSVSARIAMFLVASGFLLMAIRDASGKLLVRGTYNYLTIKIQGRTPGVGGDGDRPF